MREVCASLNQVVDTFTERLQVLSGATVCAYLERIFSFRLQHLRQRYKSMSDFCIAHWSD
jgi:hypothetical protein